MRLQRVVDVDENEMALGGRDMINVKFGTPTHYLSLYKVHQKCEILQQNRQNLLKRQKFRVLSAKNIPA